MSGLQHDGLLVVAALDLLYVVYFQVADRLAFKSAGHTVPQTSAVPNLRNGLCRFEVKRLRGCKRFTQVLRSMLRIC